MCSQQLKIGKHIKKLEIYWFIVLFCLLLIWFLIWLCCLSICCCVLFFVLVFCEFLRWPVCRWVLLSAAVFFSLFFVFYNLYFHVCRCVLWIAALSCLQLSFGICCCDLWVVAFSCLPLCFLICRCVLWFCCCMWSVVLSYFALCFVICSCFLSFAVMICSSGPPYESDLFPSHSWRLVFV